MPCRGKHFEPFLLLAELVAGSPGIHMLCEGHRKTKQQGCCTYAADLHTYSTQCAAFAHERKHLKAAIEFPLRLMWCFSF
jgi:hypothetical protein